MKETQRSHVGTRIALKHPHSGWSRWDHRDKWGTMKAKNKLAYALCSMLTEFGLLDSLLFLQFATRNPQFAIISPCSMPFLNSKYCSPSSALRSLTSNFFLRLPVSPHLRVVLLSHAR
jgi:hypothetical protein